MSTRYQFSQIEPKWQAIWERQGVFHAKEDPTIPKEKRAYVLDMFPYPSGAGLHVGHPEGYTATDIYSRYLRMQGFQVLHPMGFDAFGLPAENYAIQTGIHPKHSTETNVQRFEKQIRSLGFSYDWSRRVQTSDPEYYQWTQWIFLQLFHAGLAYEALLPVNWCASCKAILANEEVIDGKCDRCGALVTRRKLRQWVLKITQYADRLLAGLDTLDWPESIKTAQRNWIGKSTGLSIRFTVEHSAETLVTYTTRWDTIYGVTYLVIAPESPILDQIVTPERRAEIAKYQDVVANKSDMERLGQNRDKTGVFTGAYAISPVNQKRIPIWVADYVLASYGTGVVMGVPAHDERDYAFAQKFGLEILPVVAPKEPSASDALPLLAHGTVTNSGPFSGLSSAEALQTMQTAFITQGFAEAQTQYKLRDWGFSRQRYWGEPIPIVHCPQCGTVPVPESELPLRLPDAVSYEPSDTGESPLAHLHDWVQCACPRCGGPASRETNTMPQWAGSCWYYLRYTDPHNASCLADPSKQAYWLPVDLYIGGTEHAVLHLLYARFWHQFLYDKGWVTTPEPFQKLRNQGMILGENGEKMSKSRGNVVNPDEIIQEIGADAFRMYEMFMGPLHLSKPWSTQGARGVKRFLDKVWRLFFEFPMDPAEAPEPVLYTLHQSIAKVTRSIESLNTFNTAVSQLMILVNTLHKEPKQNQAVLETLLKLLAPFAPHMAEELWEHLGHTRLICLEPWPTANPQYAQLKQSTIAIQINGKLQATIDLPNDTSPQVMQETALQHPKIQERLQSQSIRKLIAIPRKVVNIVLEP